VIDLEQNSKISTIKINPFGKTGGGYFYNSAWNVKFSTDGQNWQNFQNVEKLSGAGNLQSTGISITSGDPGHGQSSPEHKFYKFSFDPVVARHVKFTVTGGDAGGDSNLDEIEIFGASSGGGGDDGEPSTPTAPAGVAVRVEWK